MFLSLGLAACGGGGDDGPQPPAPTSFAITAANAEAAVAKSWQAGDTSAGFAAMAGAGGVVTATSAGAAKADPGLPSTTTLIHLVQQVSLGPEILPCQVSGSITLSGELANPTTLTAGDVITVVADACDDGLGEVLDGEMRMTVDAIAGDFVAGAYDLTMTLELTNFQVTTEADVINSNGDVTVTLDTLAAPAVSARTEGSEITVDGNTESLILADFESDRTLDAGISPSPWTLEVSGTLDASELPGTIEYSTPVTFEGFDDNYPHTGELLVTGEDSSARLVTLDEVDVRIDVDLDGDGTVDTSIASTWDELDD
jgi:hypothetical protein